MDEALDALLTVASRINEGEVLSNDLMNEEGVPVSLRLFLAAAVLTAADLPVNKKTITFIAPAARSAAYRDHGELMERAKHLLPNLVAAQLRLAGKTVSVADLAAQLELAHQSIRRERARADEAETRLAHVSSYARELHWALEPEHEAVLREKRTKVHDLRAAQTPVDPP